MSHDNFGEELIQKLIDEGMKTSILSTPSNNPQN